MQVERGDMMLEMQVGRLELQVVVRENSWERTDPIVGMPVEGKRVHGCMHIQVCWGAQQMVVLEGKRWPCARPALRASW